MKNILKYILLFIFLASFSYVLFEQWISSAVILWIVIIISSTLSLFWISRYINKWKFHKFLLIYTFLFCIYSPMIGRKETQSLEKRELTQFPHFRFGNVWKFLSQYEDYFDDRFAFRNIMLELNGKIKLHLLETSPVREKVEIGKEQWLFSSGKNYVNLTSTIYSEKELKLIRTNLELITRWLGERNIRYYFICLPVKARIYPDKMPYGLLKQCAFSKLNQVYDYIKNDTNINVIDVRDELSEGRKIRETYLKTDTHWNQFGSFLAYQKIMRTIGADFPQINQDAINEYSMDSILTDGGDLLMFMGLLKGIPFMNYNVQLKNAAEPLVIDSSTVPGFSSATYIREMPDSVNGLRLLVVRDSFTEFLKKFLTPSFDRTLYAWMPNIPIPLIMHEKPDIVLHEMLEMFMNHNCRLPAEIKSDTVFMNTFAPGYDELIEGIDFNRLSLTGNL